MKNYAASAEGVAMFDRTDPDLPTFFGGRAMNEMEYLNEIITKEREAAMAKERRETSYPACTLICTVPDVWGPGECRKICPGKFE